MRDTSAARPSTAASSVLRLIVVDAGVLCALIVATAIWVDTAAALLGRGLGLDATWAGLLVVVAAVAAALPFLVGIGRLSRRLGHVLAESALPRRSAGVDLDAAPRRALVITLQLGVALGTAVVVVAVTQPFLPSYPGPLLLLGLSLSFGIALWQSATNLEGHVRAGSQAIVETLAAYARSDGAGRSGPPSLTAVHELLAGLGQPVAIELDDASPAVGKSLADLNLRGRTGASVLAIMRAGSAVAPTAAERLAAGDVVAVAGTHDAIDAATAMLRGQIS